MYSGTVKAQDLRPRPENPHRPVVLYHGGKWRIADWIISQFPSHYCYVEPYAGAASVFFKKFRSRAEVINDLDEAVVNVFECLRDPGKAEQLERAVRCTPWSRKEYERTYEACDDPIEWARRIVSRAWMSYGTTWQRGETGVRSKIHEKSNRSSREWETWPDQIRFYTARLRGVVVECKPAIEVIEQHDTRETLFYLDPPYLKELRTTLRWPCDEKKCYRHEMTDQNHVELAEVLSGIQGMAVISGYPGDLYEKLYSNWTRITKRAYADKGKERTEALWMNRAVMERPGLFSE